MSRKFEKYKYYLYELTEFMLEDMKNARKRKDKILRKRQKSEGDQNFEQGHFDGHRQILLLMQQKRTKYDIHDIDMEKLLSDCLKDGIFASSLKNYNENEQFLSSLVRYRDCVREFSADLLKNALACKNSKRKAKKLSKNYYYKAGKLLAFCGIICSMQDLARGFLFSLSDVNLADVDPYKDLI